MGSITSHSCLIINLSFIKSSTYVIKGITRETTAGPICFKSWRWVEFYCFQAVNCAPAEPTFIPQLHKVLVESEHEPPHIFLMTSSTRDKSQIHAPLAPTLFEERFCDLSCEDFRLCCLQGRSACLSSIYTLLKRRKVGKCTFIVNTRRNTAGLRDRIKYGRIEPHLQNTSEVIAVHRVWPSYVFENYMLGCDLFLKQLRLHDVINNINRTEFG